MPGRTIGHAVVMSDRRSRVSPTVKAPAGHGGRSAGRWATGPAVIFDAERLDRDDEGHAEMPLRRIVLSGSNPSIRYRYTTVSSNVGLHDFDRRDVSAGVRAVS